MRRIKMKIKIINPNTTVSMTDSVREAALGACGPDTEIIAVNPPCGPDSIECYVDEYLAIPGVLQEVIKGDLEEDVDGFIIACFGDPGLLAAREVTDKPVIGIAESAIAAAKFLAPYFSIVSVLDRSRKVTEDVVKNYGAENFCRSIRSTGLSVLEFGENPEKGLNALKEQSLKAIKEDGAECILLGCAGFVDFVKALQEELGVPVLDGVVPAVKFMEALIGLNVKTSKVNTLQNPEKKVIKGFESLVEVERIMK